MYTHKYQIESFIYIIHKKSTIVIVDDYDNFYYLNAKDIGTESLIKDKLNKHLLKHSPVPQNFDGVEIDDNLDSSSDKQFIVRQQE